MFLRQRLRKVKRGALKWNGMASKFKSLQSFSNFGVFIDNSKQKRATKSYELSLISKPLRMRFLYFISKVEIDINTLQVLFDTT